MSNQRSPVWNYFKKSDENDDPTCKLCKKKVKTKAGNTTNLMSHLKTNHLLVYTMLNRARKRTLSMSGPTAESSPTTTAQKSCQTRHVSGSCRKFIKNHMNCKTIKLV